MNSSTLKFIIAIMTTLLFSTVATAQEAQLRIPSLEVDAPIIPLVIRALPEGTTWDTSPLWQNVGYFTGTGWFGEGRNIVLGGHSEGADRVQEVFYDLDDITVDDEIYASANGQEYKYIVSSVETVGIYDLESLYPTTHEQLTIITCDTASYNGASYQQRIVVRALPA